MKNFKLLSENNIIENNSNLVIEVWKVPLEVIKKIKKLNNLIDYGIVEINNNQFTWISSIYLGGDITKTDIESTHDSNWHGLIAAIDEVSNINYR